MAKQTKSVSSELDDPTVMTRVTLSRAVDHLGEIYKPGFEHVVDAATLAALGDAVLTREPA